MERSLNALAASQTISISVSRRISCARSYRTLRDGSFEDAFPGTSCQATIGLSLRDVTPFFGVIGDDKDRRMFIETFGEATSSTNGTAMKTLDNFDFTFLGDAHPEARCGLRAPRSDQGRDSK
jgi:hypothetical protein